MMREKASRGAKERHALTQGWWRHGCRQQECKILELLEMPAGKLLSDVPMDRPLFQPNPSTVHFTNDCPRRTSRATVQLRNLDKVSRCVYIEAPECEALSLRRLTPNRGVAPGMSADYEIAFRPETDAGGVWELVVATERERFALPVVARGARLEFDLPDVIDCGKAPVKTRTTRSYLLTNVGSKRGTFHLDSESEAFEVRPRRGTLDVDASLQCTIRFAPGRVGAIRGALTVKYGHGDNQRVELMGEGLDLAVSLIEKEVEMPATYITQSSSRLFHVSNPSGHCVRFHSCIQGGEGVFEMYPMEGVMPPYSHQQCIVEFCPKSAGSFKGVCEIDAEGCTELLSVDLIGEGLGPNVRFEKACVNAEDVFVGVCHEFEAVLLNEGEIEASFEMMPPSNQGSLRCKCRPQCATLPPHQTQRIKIEVVPEKLGPFSERVQWRIRDREDVLSLSIKGIARAPSFKISDTELSFGHLAVGFPVSKALSLRNTSLIPFEFDFCHTLEGLKIEPATGRLFPADQSQIQLTLTPTKPGDIEQTIEFCMKGVDAVLETIAVRGKSTSPVLRWQTANVDLGSCFVEHGSQMEAVLINESDFPAKFYLDALNQEEVAEVFLRPSEGCLEAKSSVAMQLELIPKKLGKHTLAIPVKTTGSLDSKLELDFSCVGPTLTLASEDSRFSAKTRSVAFGEISVIQDHKIPLQLSNTSPIHTKVQITLESVDSCFSTEPRQLQLEPGTSETLTLNAHLDDASLFKDTLEIKLSNGEPIRVSLSARGTGSTVLCSLPPGLLDLERLYVASETRREIVFENKGRKAAQLKWSCQDLQHKTKRSKPFPVDATPEQVFRLEPSELEVPARSSARAALVAQSMNCGEFLEKHRCEELPRKKGKKSLELLTLDISARVIQPILKFSQKKLDFEWNYAKPTEQQLLSHPLSIQNIAALSVSVTLKCSEPFHCSLEKAKLDSQEEISVVVTFDPAAVDTLHASQHRGKLEVICDEGEKSDAITLLGIIRRPNIDFDDMQIDFGRVQQNCTHRREVLMENVSDLEAEYHWSFCRSKEDEMNGAPHVFDILPIKGTVQPGKKEPISFSFYALPDFKSSIDALCHVKGGPSYRICLSGHTGEIQYSLHPTLLELGKKFYGSSVHQTVVIKNEGPVPFSFEVLLKELRFSYLIRCSDTTGRVLPGSEAVIDLWINVAIPGELHEALPIKIEHCDPEYVKIHLECIFPELIADLPSIGEAMQSGELNDLNEDTAPLSHIILLEQIQKKLSAQSQKASLADFKGRHGRRCRSLYAWHYLLDFGQIPTGAATSKSFTLTNANPLLATFSVQKQLEGVTFETRDSRELLQHASAECTVRIDAASLWKAETDETLVEEVIPVRIKKGPSLALHLRARIIQPKLHLSATSLDFGQVRIGFAKTMFVQLSNPTEVVCDWKVHQSSALLACYTAPVSGSLKPGCSQNVEVHFVPSPGMDLTFATELNFVVQNSAEIANVLVNGTVLCPMLRLDPDHVTFDSLMLSDLQEKEERKAPFQIHNDSPFPVTVTAPDFDRCPSVETTQSIQLNEMNEHGFCLLPVPEASMAMTPETDFSQESGQLIINQELAEDSSSLPLCIVVLGDPGNAQVQASLMAERYGVPEVSVDQIIQEMLDQEEPLDLESLPICLSEMDLSTVSDVVELLLSEKSGPGKGDFEDDRPELDEDSKKSCLLYLLKKGFKECQAFEEGMVLKGVRSKFLNLEASIQALVELLTDSEALGTEMNLCWLNCVQSEETEREQTLEANAYAIQILAEGLQRAKERNASLQFELREVKIIEGDPVSTHHLACGISFKRGCMTSLLPPVPADQNLVPDPYISQVIRKENSIDASPAKTYPFRLMPPAPSALQESLEEATEEEELYRWEIPAHGKQTCTVWFDPCSPGLFKEDLLFEVWSADRCFRDTTAAVPLTVQGLADYPQIQICESDTQEETLQLLDFGPLPLNQGSERTIRIKNLGPFRSAVAFDIEQKDTETQAGDASSPFAVDDAQMLLESGESGDLIVKATPLGDSFFEAKLICNIEGNPKSTELQLCCIGAPDKLVLLFPDQDEGIRFGRCLVASDMRRELSVLNEGLLPVEWSLEGDMPSCLSLSPMQGLLTPGQRQKILVEASSTEEWRLDHVFTLKGGSLSLPFSVKGECYAIKAELSFPEGSSVLEFGTCQADQSCTKTISLTNFGTYPLSIQSKHRSEALSLLHLMLEKEVVHPQETITLEVIYNSEGILPSSELHLVDGIAAFQLEIVDLESEEIGETLNVPVAIHAVFSSFTVTPRQSLEFGIHRSGDHPQPQTIQIKNTGPLSFAYRIEAESVQEQDSESNIAENKAHATHDPFLLNKTAGMLEPDSADSIAVSFFPEGNRNYSQNLMLRVENAKAKKNDLCLQLMGTSCIPAIDVSDVHSIFEEHRVSQNRIPTAQDPYYCIDDNIFFFGTCASDMEPTTDKDIQEGREIRFKFTNPSPLPVSLMFDIEAEGECPEVSKKCFKLKDESFRVPAFGWKYLSLHFLPCLVGTTMARLNVRVDDQEACIFSCGLQGEGAIPSITLQGLQQQDQHMLQFGQVYLGDCTTQSFTLANNGLLNAIVEWSFEMEETSFRVHDLQAEGTTITIPAGSSRLIDLAFAPTEKGIKKQNLKLKVQGNPFGEWLLQFSGEGVEAIVSFEGDSMEHQTLRIGDVYVGSPKTTVFSLLNRSHEALKFCWKDMSPGWSLAPLEGILKESGSALMTASYSSQESRALDQDVLRLATCRVQEDTENETWTEKTLQVEGRCDDVHFSCSVEEITFPQTCLFDSRTSVFQLSNDSTVAFDYRWIVDTDCESVPFGVSPSSGCLKANEAVQVDVRFCPAVEGAFHGALQCQVTQSGREGPSISLNAQAVAAVCHVDLPKKEGEPHLRSLHFQCRSTSASVSQSFAVMNLTSSALELTCQPITTGVTCFRCAKARHNLLPGERKEIEFTFDSADHSTARALWKICISQFPEFKVPVVLTSEVMEAQVSVSPAVLNFGDVLCGTTAQRKIQIRNEESRPLRFKFRDCTEAPRKSILNKKTRPCVDFRPKRDSIAAHSCQEVTVLFYPTTEEEINCTVPCLLGSSELNVNIKGSGCKIKAAMYLSCEDHTQQPIYPHHKTALDFGQLIVMGRSFRTGMLYNRGTIAFDFDWRMALGHSISIEPASGHVLPFQSMPFSIEYHPVAAGALKEEKVQCRIQKGPCFDLLINGSSFKPKIKLSFKQHDFGTVFVRREGMKALEAPLIIANKTKCDMALHLYFEAAHPDLTVSKSAMHLSSLQEDCVSLVYFPLQKGLLDRILTICVNDCYTMRVAVRAEAIPLKIQCAPTALDFGNVPPRRSGKERVAILNKSALPVTLSLKSCSDQLRNKDLSLPGSKEFTIAARDSAEMSVVFQPTGRIDAFEERCFCEIEGAKTPLFQIHGSSQGAHFRLSHRLLDFGPVACGNAKTETVLITHDSLSECSFCWHSSHKDVTMEPPRGVLFPGRSSRIQISYRPQKSSEEPFTATVTCSTQEGEKQRLHVRGICSPCGVQDEKLEFSCAAGCAVSQKLTIGNDTLEPWTQIRAEISHAIWTLKQPPVISPKSTENVEIEFRPTADFIGDITGAMTLYFPDGGARKIQLHGTVESAIKHESIERSIPMRVQHIEKLQILNSRPSLCKFQIAIDQQTCAEAVVIKGDDHLWVPPKSKQEYSIFIESWVEGDLCFAVEFKNEDPAMESMVYHCSFRAEPPATNGQVRMEALVRSETATKIPIHNPLPREIPLTITCPHPQVKCPSELYLSTNGAVSEIELSFLPLVEGEAISQVHIESDVLGSWSYDLQLIGLHPAPEPPLRFTAALGDCQTKTLTLKHCSNCMADYTCRTDPAEFCPFLCPRACTAETNQIKISIVYEPISCGERQEAMLFVESPEGGVFEVPLLGTCTFPKPRGPIDVHGTLTLPIKNVFFSDVQFNCQIDNPFFKLKPMEQTASKQTAHVTIETSKEKSSNQRQRGTLTVTCPTTPHSKWSYYLQSKP